MFKILNTKSLAVEPIQPYQQGTIHMYSCGPTVYDYAHIGNLRSYIFVDILKKSLELSGFNVKHVMNITDIDDKILNKLTEKYPKDIHLDELYELTNPFIQAFFDDMHKLAIKKADYYPKATEHIPRMVEMVHKLIETGYAYESNNSIYFNISKFKEYGTLSQLDFSSIKTGTRYNTDEYDKNDIRDFVLWKNNPQDVISWDTHIGKGRPGWHLECSAMIQDLLSGKVDIHTGGVDLIFPHHENEIAQSQATYQDDFVKYWVHCEHLLVDGKKMSKSLGNFYTLKDILQKDFHPISLRYLMLSVPYSQKLNFTLEALQQAENTIKNIAYDYERFLQVEINSESDYDSQLNKNIEEFKDLFLDSLQNNLNTAKALNYFHDFLHFLNKYLHTESNKIHTKNKTELEHAFKYFDSTLSILEGCLDFIHKEIPTNILTLLESRNKARQDKSFSLADNLREEIGQQGYKILDLKNTSYLIKK